MIQLIPTDPETTPPPGSGDMSLVLVGLGGVAAVVVVTTVMMQQEKVLSLCQLKV